MTIEQVKAWLRRYGEQQQQLDHLCEQYDLLDTRAANPHAPRLDGMPHGSGDPVDSLGGAVGYLDELAQEIYRLQAEATDTRREINAAIRKITGPRWADKQGVLQFRYLLCLPWPEVTDALFGAKVDYLDKAETYQRRVFELHRAAIEALAEILPAEAGQEMMEEKNHGA